MHGLGIWLTRHARLALFGFIGLVFASSFLGFQSFGNLAGGGYEDPNGDSQKVDDILFSEFDIDPAEVVVLADLDDVATEQSSIDTVSALNKELAGLDGVASVEDYYTLGSPETLISEDKKLVYLLVDLENDADKGPIVDIIVDDFTGSYLTAEVHIAGFEAITKALNETIYTDIITAELIAVPLAILLLVFVFGTLVAAGLPLMVGALAIIASFLVVWIFSLFTEMSVFSLNLITGLGLGLGIDYSLLIINRWREERANGLSIDESTVKTVETAGRTVFFSGLTVAVTLLSLGFFPQSFLRSFAISGFTVVLMAVLGAIIALPAALQLLGDRVNKLKVIKGDLNPKPFGLWYKLARFSARRAIVVAVVAVTGLGGLASLSSDAVFGQVDDRILPKENPAVVASDLIRDRFDGRANDPVEIVVAGYDDQQLSDYVEALSEVEGITSVQSPLGITEDGSTIPQTAAFFANYVSDDYSRIVAVSDVEPRSTDGYDLIVDVREVDNGFEEILVGGGAAFYTDSQQGIERNAPTALIWILIATSILLFLFTGSIILPLKAIVLTVLSLGATLGFITWVFLGGELMWLIGEFQVTGSLDTSSLVLVGVVAFGLSMDYELFLLSRIKEEHEKGVPTSQAVAIGLQRSGRIITAAALILAVTFGAFGASGVSIMKMLGLGIAFAILLDATVVRAILVPSIMRLLGKYNWYAPKPLKKVYDRLGISH